MPQDQLFKELLREFFREFMELFYPHVAERLDFDRVTFLDKEAFTDFPEGSRREADLIAQVYTRDGQPEIIIVHIEVQAKRERTVPARIFEYYGLFRFRHRLPILPIVLYLAPGAGGIVQETHTESVLGIEVLRFVYQVVGIPDLQSDDYRTRTNSLAPALSAMMKHGAMSDVLRKAMIVREQAIIEQNEARLSLLLYLVDRYIPLTGADEEAFQTIMAKSDFLEANGLMTSWERRGFDKGIEQGIEQGVVSGMRRTLLRQVELRFGPITPGLRSRVEGIDSLAELETLLDRLVGAPNLDALGLN